MLEISSDAAPTQKCKGIFTLEKTLSMCLLLLGVLRFLVIYFVKVQMKLPAPKAQGILAEFFRSRIPSFAPRHRLGASEGLFSSPCLLRRSSHFGCEGRASLRRDRRVFGEGE